MAKIERIDKVMKVLKDRIAKANEANVSVAIGYTAAYALALHERVEMKWRGFPRSMEVRVKDGVAYYGYDAGEGKGLFWGPKGQAKFLEQPFRQLRGVFAKIVKGALLKGQTMAQGLLLAGLRLQRESMQLVPIDTGNLRASAFTRLEK